MRFVASRCSVSTVVLDWSAPSKYKPILEREHAKLLAADAAHSLTAICHAASDHAASDHAASDHAAHHEAAASQAAAASEAGFDLIVAADVLHEATAPYMVAALLDSLLVVPGAACLIADPLQRTRRPQFMQACREVGLVVHDGPLPAPPPNPDAPHPMRLFVVERSSGGQSGPDSQGQ